MTSHRRAIGIGKAWGLGLLILVSAMPRFAFTAAPPARVADPAQPPPPPVTEAVEVDAGLRRDGVDNPDTREVIVQLLTDPNGGPPPLIVHPPPLLGTIIHPPPLIENPPFLVNQPPPFQVIESGGQPPPPPNTNFIINPPPPSIGEPPRFTEQRPGDPPPPSVMGGMAPPSISTRGGTGTGTDSTLSLKDFLPKGGGAPDPGTPSDSPPTVLGTTVKEPPRELESAKPSDEFLADFGKKFEQKEKERRVDSATDPYASLAKHSDRPPSGEELPAGVTGPQPGDPSTLASGGGAPARGAAPTERDRAISEVRALAALGVPSDEAGRRRIVAAIARAEELSGNGSNRLALNARAYLSGGGPAGRGPTSFGQPEPELKAKRAREGKILNQLALIEGKRGGGSGAEKDAKGKAGDAGKIADAAEGARIDLGGKAKPEAPGAIARITGGLAGYFRAARTALAMTGLISSPHGSGSAGAKGGGAAGTPGLMAFKRPMLAGLFGLWSPEPGGGESAAAEADLELADEITRGWAVIGMGLLLSAMSLHLLWKVFGIRIGLVHARREEDHTVKRVKK